jgi:hypothetical protein
MKRWLGISMLFLAGCPIYSDDGYVTPIPPKPVPQCGAPTDCASGQVCDPGGVCRNGGCDVYGCVSPYQCVVESGAAVCKQGVPAPKPDAGPGTPDAKPFTGCRSDQECVTSKGAGAKCLSGECASLEDQCSDATQCRSGEQCVEGSCTRSCSATLPCPTGYGCDLAKGVCTETPKPCTTGAQCPGQACVEGRCVSGCAAQAPACSGGLVCVNNGCVVDERPTFSCATDGQVGDGTPGKCANGSICLRKSCYISCDPAVADSCKNADKFNQCKSVTTTSGEHYVCGSTANLGSECDLAAAKPCSGTLVCIDGYCR